MADTQRVANTLQGLRALQETPLSIIRLSEPITATPASHRTSDASSSAFDDPSPASLKADLSHYKELFSKLRFSYLEQVTKEKFLRAIVGDPPQIVEPAENIELETQLAAIKSVLKAQKTHVADIIQELEDRGRDLSRRYETISLQTTLLATLPEQIQGLGRTLEDLRARNRSQGTGRSEEPDLNLPLPATQALVEDRRSELLEVEKQLKMLQQALPRQTRVLEREEREVTALEGERERAVVAAREAVERRRDGGGADELEWRGRWLRAQEMGLRGLLGVEG